MRRVAAVSLIGHCELSEAIQGRSRRSGWLRNDGLCMDGLSLLVSTALLAAPALAAPRTIDDCESIKEPNAYNLCLASFGPVRGQHGASYPGVASEGRKGGETGDAKSPGAGGRAGAPRGSGLAARPRGSGLGGSGLAATRGHGGRVRMEFTPGRR